MRSRKILFTARDPGGAGVIAPLANHFTAKGWKVNLAASDPALTMLRNEGLSPLEFSIGPGKDHILPEESPERLLSEAERLLAITSPDAVLTSLSSFGAGVDEAVLSKAEVPAFAVQDFWGDVNIQLGVPNALYLVIDEYAARITEERFNVRTEIVGAVKYVSYREIDVLRLRKEYRGLCKTAPDEYIISWFSQSPEIPGHEDAFNDFLTAVSGMSVRPKLVFRGHPKFVTEIPERIKEAESFGLEIIDATGQGKAEGWLAASDIVATPFSLCGVDHAFLAANSPRPLGCVVYFLTNKPLRRFFTNELGLEYMPTAKQGAGFMAWSYDEARLALEKALEEEAARKYHLAAKRLQKDDPLSNVYCIVEHYIR